MDSSKHGASNHIPTKAEIKARRKKERINKKRARR